MIIHSRLRNIYSTNIYRRSSNSSKVFTIYNARLTIARTTTRQPRTVTIDLIDFMTVNRFLFDVISDTTITSLKDTARQLAISSNTIHDQLLDAGLPVRLRPLRNACTGLADKLGQPPPVYVTYYRSITEGFLLDDRALELLIPVTSYHFDYKGLILTRFNEMSPDRVALITSKWFLSAPVWDDDWTLKYFPDKESRSFQRQMISFFDDRPDCLKCLTNDELFQANSQLSVAFLHLNCHYTAPWNSLTPSQGWISSRASRE